MDSEFFNSLSEEDKIKKLPQYIGILHSMIASYEYHSKEKIFCLSCFSPGTHPHRSLLKAASQEEVIYLISKAVDNTIKNNGILIMGNKNIKIYDAQGTYKHFAHLGNTEDDEFSKIIINVVRLMHYNNLTFDGCILLFNISEIIIPSSNKYLKYFDQ